MWRYLNCGIHVFSLLLMLVADITAESVGLTLALFPNAALRTNMAADCECTVKI